MSDADVTLRAEGLCKYFVEGGHRPTVFTLLRNFATRSNGSNGRFCCLDGIELEVRRGELVGLVGENGAGKTTLLKTIAGVYRPSAGRVEIRGHVTLLGGLGVGMVDELSVAKNVQLYGAICRVPRRTLTERFDEILAWADLERFRDAELRTLSTGMRTRLAFAIAMHIDSELLLLDEAFSAGDKSFQARCDRFFSRRQGLPATLIATHNLEFVASFCDRTLWLHKGKQMALGPTATILPRYREFSSA